MNIGELHIDKLYIGELQVDKVYLGETLVYGGDEEDDDDSSAGYRVCIADINGAWFDTGIPNRLDIKTEILFKLSEDTTPEENMLICGARTGNNQNCNFFFKEKSTNTRHKAIYYAGNYYASNTTFFADKWHRLTTLLWAADDTYTLSNGRAYDSFGGYKVYNNTKVMNQISGRAFDNTNSETLLIGKVQGLNYPFRGVMEYAKYYTGEGENKDDYITPIKDFCFVECPDGQVRLYDRIGKQLYENQSDTGTISVAEYTGEIIPIE